MLQRRKAILAVLSMALPDLRASQAQQSMTRPPAQVILDGLPVVAIVHYKGQTVSVTADDVWNALHAKD